MSYFADFNYLDVKYITTRLCMKGRKLDTMIGRNEWMRSLKV